MTPPGSEHWYCVALERSIRGTPRAFTCLETPLVLFRDAEGHVAALLDRCAHRGARLSAGRIREGQLTCPYHGWRFDRQGACVRIPSQLPGETIPERCQVPVRPVRVQQGLVWVWMGEARSELPPVPTLPGSPEPGWAHVTFASRFEADVEEVVENFIDCPHTGFVHGGLFRSEPDHETRARIRQVPEGIDIELEETGASDSLLARVLARGRKVVHVDRFRLPATVHVNYRFGDDLEFHGFQICTPVKPGVTHVFVHVTWKAGPVGGLLRPLVRLVGGVILAQDRTVLEDQARSIRIFGRQARSTRADAANVWIRRLRSGELPETTRELEVKFRL
ncbi:MAG: aromatic ring-hydroxylating dioxygenase subunit alpha [bacterium]|nr:aromatic ring-hydroxylating dioxygenase subunit alpha [bacterium]